MVAQRVARLAGGLAALGGGPRPVIALYLRNLPEYKEAELAIARMGAVCVHLNYRYVDDELLYLLRDAEASVIVYQRCFAERVERLRGRLPMDFRLVEVDDGSDCASIAMARRFEDLAAGPPAPPAAVAGEDVVLIYTGGTTGRPKGVMFTHEAAVRFTTVGYEFAGLAVPAEPAAVVAAAAALVAAGEAPVSLVCAPFMHSTGSTLGFTMPVMMGGTVILTGEDGLCAAEAWSLVERHRVTQMVIVGDAMGRPLLNELDAAAARGRPYDIASLRMVVSSGVMWTREVKSGLLAHRDMRLVDFLGSSEGGMGMSVATRDNVADTARFIARPGLKLLDEDGSEIPWGSGRAGLVATTGNIPHGYRNDPAKTAATFRTIDGVRYSVPGDYATIDADGHVTMLGRMSGCINTGGEKVFAEEVEEVLKRHPAVTDCLVVGIADVRFGQSVAAVVAIRAGAAVDVNGLQAFARHSLAGYKVPRTIILTDRVARGPNGKADYSWARSQLSAAG